MIFPIKIYDYAFRLVFKVSEKSLADILVWIIIFQIDVGWRICLSCIICPFIGAEQIDTSLYRIAWIWSPPILEDLSLSNDTEPNKI